MYISKGCTHNDSMERYLRRGQVMMSSTYINLAVRVASCCQLDLKSLSLLVP